MGCSWVLIIRSLVRGVICETFLGSEDLGVEMDTFLRWVRPPEPDSIRWAQDPCPDEGAAGQGEAGRLDGI